jgi:peptide/nickel transport system substrate-binding protein
MDERELRQWVQRVKDGTVTRREFTWTMLGLGLTAPMAAQMLNYSGVGAGVAQAQPKPAFNPTRRGGGGPVKTLWWQAPVLLNPHLSPGTKDVDASRIFYEPLCSFDPDGNLVPVLAADVPTLQNGGVSKDGLSVTWRLKKNVAWHDGKPFTADDVVATWEWAADPASAAVTSGSYKDIARIDKPDSHTARITFTRPAPFPFEPFCGPIGQVLPKHVFEPFKGAKSREAPANLKPVGTGPYRIVDFKPGDSVKAEINPNYHVPNRPFFDTLEMKGGGDTVSAARAVLQTGEYDYAWNLLVEDDILLRLEQGGKGRVEIVYGGNIEFISVNQSDPWTEVDGEWSSPKSKHPFFSDLAVRSALNLLVDRGAVQEQIYGRQARASANFLNAPARFRSSNMKWEFNVDKANQVLDQAGWRRGSDGVRVKEGTRLKVLYQTSINAPRQKTQQIVKQACAKAGIDVEIKSVVASVFFASDPANWDTYPHFKADLQMYNTTMVHPDPQRFMNQFLTEEIASKANKWSGRNPTRWSNEEYDRTWKAADSEMDSVKRAAMFIKMNDLLIQNVVVIPVLWRARAYGLSNRLRNAELSPWESDFWNHANWYREA